MRSSWIQDIKEFENIAKEWDGVLFSSQVDNPFLLSDFILTWWKHYSENFSPRVFVLYNKDNKIIGGLPLYSNKNGHLKYLGGVNAAYTEFLNSDDQQIIWDVFFTALNQIKDWRSLCLQRWRKNKLNIDELKLAACKHKDVMTDIYRSEYTYLINIPKDFSKYIERLPKKLRYYIRRSEKELSKLGKIVLDSLDNKDELSEWCNKYFQLSRDSFKYRNRESAFENEKYRLFFKDLIERFYLAGYLDAHALKLNGKIIAIHFGYSIRNNLNYLFPAFDIDFANLNPGHLLIYKLIEISSRNNNQVFDFFTGSRLYKQQWSNYREEIMSIEIRPSGIRSSIQRALAKNIARSSLANTLKEKIRHTPSLERLKYRIRKIMTDGI